jgi:ABC-type lipoprotein export system ATPase subunit
MKILKMEAENVKRLKVVSITPDGSLIQLSGANGAGKSSVLDAIAYGLGGTWQIPAQPLRQGEKAGKIVLELGNGQQSELKVTRDFTETGTTLTVQNVAGATFPSPQKMLDALLGKFTFDPLEFSRMKPPQQLETLRGMVKLDISLDDLADANKRDYDERRDLRKELTGIESRITAIEVPQGTPGEPLDISTMVDTLQRAAEANTALERERAARDATAKIIADGAEESERYRRRAAELRREAAHQDELAKATDAKVAEGRAKLQALPALAEPVDTAKLAQEIEAGRRTNEAVQLKARREALLHEHTAKTSRLSELNTAMEARRKQGEDAIRRAKMPLKGLGFTDDGVTYGGLPLEQASGAEQLRVSVAIAMAANPKLRVLRIKDGSLLDAGSLRMIAEMAEAADYQVWIEVVDTTGKVGIVMEDGEIATVNPSTVSAAAKTPKKSRAKNGHTNA